MSVNDLGNPIQAFVKFSHEVFATIPRDVVETEVTNDFRLCVLQSSALFRNALRNLNEEISSIAESRDIADDNEATQFDAEFDMIYRIEQIWHICEVALLSPSNQVFIEAAKWLKGANTLDIADFKHLLRLQEQPELLKSDRSNANSLDYWDVVFKLVMQGNLVDASEVLVMHSEISSSFLLNTPESSARSGNSIDYRSCRALFDVMLSHPYYSLISNDGEGRNEVDPSVNLREWHAEVEKFRQSRNEVLMRIPQLDKVLCLLLGEMEDLSDVADGDWKLMSLSMLLYVYPPSRSRVEVSQIVNEAVQYLENIVEPNGRPRILIEAQLSRTVREVLGGNVGPALISLHNSGNQFLASTLGRGSEDSSPPAVHTVSLLSLAHLALLLVCGADKMELTSKLSASTSSLIKRGGGSKTSSLGTDFECGDVSFLEKLLLEASQGLNRFEELPVHILLSYLEACPDQGREYARCLLLRRKLHSDEQALEIASALHSLEYFTEADAVVMQRVHHWLQQSHPLYQSLDFVKAITVPHTDVVNHCLKGSSGGTPYPLQSLAVAVQLLQRINNTPYLDSLVDRSLYQCMCAVSSCAPLFSGLTVFPMAPVPNNSPSFVYQPSVPDKKAVRSFSNAEESQLIAHLEAVLQEANEVLDAIDLEGFVPTANIQMLSAYVEAIRARLYESESLSALYSAALTINDLLNNEQLAVPHRYYLHLVDLSLWLSRAIGELKKIQLYSPRVNDPVAGSSGADSLNNYVLSRADAYRLLTGFTKITTSWASERFVAGSGANAADLQSLRLALLGQVANSVVQDNANHHATRMALSRVNGGSGAPGSGMMKSDVYLRNRLPHATSSTAAVGSTSAKSTGISSKLSLTGLKAYSESPSFGAAASRNVYFRAAGYPTDPLKANEIRSQMKTFEALTASVTKFTK